MKRTSDIHMLPAAEPGIHHPGMRGPVMHMVMLLLPGFQYGPGRCKSDLFTYFLGPVNTLE
jgi:hypothetical protein